MKFYIIFVFMLYWSSANSTFWFKNDFEHVVDTNTYRDTLSNDYFSYLRALSIFKRKVQLLGFYDDLEYVPLDEYIIEDDYDDEMYELLKKMKKEKKSRRKFLKKKKKKLKKKISSTTTTAKPITNIVYYWPFTIISNSNENGNGYQQSSVGANEFDKTVKTGNENGFDTQRKLEVVCDDEINNSKSSDQSVHHTNVLTKQESGKGKANQTPVSSTTITSTTTQYPLLTAYPDPDEVMKLIQEILDQQELINKISVEEQGNLTLNGTIRTTKDVLTKVEDDIELNTTSNFSNPVEDNLSQFGDELHQEMIQVQTGNQDEEYFSELTKTASESESEEDVQHRLEEGLSFLDSIKSQMNESEYHYIGSTVEKDNHLERTTETLEIVVESTTSIPSGVLDFFPDTLPDEHFSTSISSNHSKIPDNITVSDYNPKHPDISSEILETKETTETAGGHLEIDSGHNDTTPQVNEQTIPSRSITQPFNEDLTSVNYSEHPHTTDKTSETTVTIPQTSDIHSELNVLPQSAGITEQPETMPYHTVIEYLDLDIDPKEFNDTFESRGLTNVPMFTVTFDDKNERSDVAIELDDFSDYDTTDDLPYNLSSDNVLEQSNVIENVSGETSTELHTKDAINLDTIDQIDSKIVSLIPIILKQMKQGNINPEEMEILKATYRQFWPIILEEANRDLTTL